LNTQAVFTEEPQLARWEDSQQCWRTDGFEEVNFDETNGNISFKTQFIGPICTFQVRRRVARFDEMFMSFERY
jgi:hypothetical protein